MQHDGYMYIASPYTHSDPMIRQRRFEKALDFTVWLALKYKLWGFSPIGHSHHMGTMHPELPYTFGFWEAWNNTMIRASVGLVVLQIDGWENSKGIEAEIGYAGMIGKPIYMSRQLWSTYDHDI